MIIIIFVYLIIQTLAADLRKSIYHGFNAVYKKPPFYPLTDKFDPFYSLAEVDLQNLHSWGFNILRIFIAWEALQPQPNKFNLSYINQIRNIMRRAQKFNISFILDAHQDLYNRKFCGQGVPDWAVNQKSFPRPLKIILRKDQEGYPLLEDCLKVQFSQFYLSYDVMEFQGQFLQNKNGLADQFAQAWGEIANFFKDQQNLLGYQLLNQPSGPNIYKQTIDYLNAGKSNNQILLPFYRILNKQIRKYDNKTIIFYEPVTVDIFGYGFQQNLGGKDYQDKEIFSYHIYCPYVNKDGQPKSHLICKQWDDQQIKLKDKNAKKIKVGIFLTEFGAVSDSLNASQQLNTITAKAEELFHSWTYWQFKYFNDITTATQPGTQQGIYFQNGSLMQNKLKALSRPYFYKICGEPIQTKFDLQNQRLSLTLTVGDCGGLHSQFFVNKNFYFNLSISLRTVPYTNSQLIQLSEGYYSVKLVPQTVGKIIQIIIQ